MADGFNLAASSPQTNDLALFFETGDGSNVCAYASAPNVLKLDTWQHVAVAVDRTAGTCARTACRQAAPRAP
jgi:hypothetical protein